MSVLTPQEDEVSAATAADLLSHWWSRPLAEEVQSWASTWELATAAVALLGNDGIAPDAVGSDSVADLLDEYERLFVGPGTVPCPPYESYWREDAPLEMRRSLMGPCTAELRKLYEQLGLEVSTEAGELPDHIAVELEALAYALSFPEGLPVTRALLGEHLPAFAARLCRAVSKEAELPFYRQLAAVTISWVPALAQSVGDNTGT